MLGNIPDDQVPEVAMKFADSFIRRAEEKGSVNLFGLELGQGTFEKLRAILESKFSE